MQAQSSPGKRSFYLTALVNNTMYVASGWTPTRRLSLDLWAFDVIHSTWRSVPLNITGNPNPPVSYTSAQMVGPHMVYFSGGYQNTNGSLDIYNLTCFIDVVQNTTKCVSLPDSPEPRLLHSTCRWGDSTL